VVLEKRALMRLKIAAPGVMSNPLRCRCGATAAQCTLASYPIRHV
jgi:hypothetical protein